MRYPGRSHITGGHLPTRLGEGGSLLAALEGDTTPERQSSEPSTHRRSPETGELRQRLLPSPQALAPLFLLLLSSLSLARRAYSRVKIGCRINNSILSSDASVRSEYFSGHSSHFTTLSLSCFSPQPLLYCPPPPCSPLHHHSLPCSNSTRYSRGSRPFNILCYPSPLLCLCHIFLISSTPPPPSIIPTTSLYYFSPAYFQALPLLLLRVIRPNFPHSPVSLPQYLPRDLVFLPSNASVYCLSLSFYTRPLPSPFIIFSTLSILSTINCLSRWSSPPVHRHTTVLYRGKGLWCHSMVVRQNFGTTGRYTTLPSHHYTVLRQYRARAAPCYDCTVIYLSTWHHSRAVVPRAEVYHGAVIGTAD